MTSKMFVELVVRVHELMLDEIDAVDLQQLSPNEKLHRARDVLSSLLKKEHVALTAKLRQQVAEEAVAEVSGYGPIQPLLDDPTITEIMVNGPDKIYIERDGKLYQEDRIFKDDRHVMRIIERIIVPLGRRVDEASPMVDARLPDGSRVNAIIPPLAIDGPILTLAPLKIS